jgi:acetyl-CoA synthetase
VAKKKKKKKKSKKTRKKKSKKIIRSIKKSRKVKKSKSKRRKKSKLKLKKAKPRKINFKAPKLLEDGDGKSLIKVSDSWSNHAYVNESKYKKKYKLSIKDNDKFWAKEGKRITWIKKYTKIKDVKYSKDEVKIKWFYDGTLNASANCIDRHLKKNSSKTAIIWVGDDPTDSKKISYKELHQNVSKAANGL